MADRTRVAIVGGGCGALSAALELSRPGVGDHLDITIYQQGWRLGGKGASSRGANGRIEEHGLHLWMGFYENAFRQLRQCYAELGRGDDCPIASFDDAFVADPHVSIADRDENGAWDVWTVRFPSGNGVPGDPLLESNPYSVRNYLIRALKLLVELVRNLDESALDPATGSASEAQLIDRAERLLALGQLLTLTGFASAIQILESLIGYHASRAENTLTGLLDRAQQFVRNQLLMLVHGDPSLRRIWTVLDLMLAATRGILRFGLLTDPRGFDAIDDYDLIDWLEYNGADPTSTRNGFLRGSCYDLTFSFRDGDVEQPAFAAGVGVRCAIRMYFSYRGALFWKMRAGMGEIVFAPIYEVLKARGVKFRFFHRLTNVGIGVDGQGPHVESLGFNVQASAAGDYEPLIDVDGLPCWPDKPRFEQLDEGDALAGVDLESPACDYHVDAHMLKVGDDFDFVVLGISIGSIPATCPEILERDPRWRDMVTHVTTVATQSAQVWMNKSMAELGYDQPPGNLSGFVTPFDTWADMSHLAERENWQSSPESIAYFCSVLPDGRDVTAVKENLVTFMNRDVRHLWKRVGTEGFDTGWLVNEAGHDDPWDAQYTRANTEGSERYVQTLPGSTRFRLSPLDRTYDNLTLAGDWTANSINAGCVEAAVISGMLAAHAITGCPRLEDIIGFDQP